jgi:hypothetical protein
MQLSSEGKLHPVESENETILLPDIKPLSTSILVKDECGVVSWTDFGIATSVEVFVLAVLIGISIFLQVASAQFYMKKFKEIKDAVK